MRWLFTVFKSPTFQAVFGLLLIAALAIVAGEFFGWDWMLRILIILVGLILVLGIMMVRFMRANRRADQIEQSLKIQAEQQMLSTRPDRQGEVEELQRRLNEAIERLKQSKLGHGKRGRSALYALPWYMFIGPPGAGKTTAIINSGLNFPIGSDRIRGVGGTRNCDWFFTDQAILLDTAGRYMTETEDSEEWLAFLSTLKQHRTERPINGVIVGIGLDELTDARPDQIEWHADNIRRRVDELIKHLGVHFPVYLVFTKSDLLQGFVEFFGEYSRREREQIWGATLEGEQQQREDLRAVFTEEFNRLTQALLNRRTVRLGRPMKREERRKVYAFPLQLATVRDNLAMFVQRLFQPNPYQESPIFRGFYFTSGTQEGVPLDRVIKAIADQFDLAPAPEAMFDSFGAAETETKSYFLKDLFTDVLVPDQYLVRRTSKARRSGSMQRVGVMVASIVVFLLFLLGTSQALVRSKVSLNQARSATDEVALVRWDDPGVVTENLGRMDRLHQEIERLDRIQWLGLGLSRNGTVQTPAQQLYLDRARAFVRQYSLPALGTRMQQLNATSPLQGAERERLYEDLKAYLLMTIEQPRLEDSDDGPGHRTFVVNTLSDLAMVRLASETGATAEDLEEQVKPQVEAFVNALGQENGVVIAADERLIQVTRDRLYEPPSISGLYNRMKLEGRDNLPPMTLADLVPGRYLSLLRSSEQVSGFFTKNAWDTYVQDRIEAESQDPAGDDWVLGRTGVDLPAEMQNREQMAAQLEALYFNDYANEWERFLRSVQVTSFGNIREAARSLQQLSDPTESPIGYLLAQVTAQTTFGGGMLENLQGQATERAERAAGRAAGRAASRVAPGTNPDINLQGDPDMHPVERRFVWLHNLNATQAQTNQASADYYKAFDSLREVGAALDGLGGDEAKAADFAADVLGKDGGALDAELRNIRSALRLSDQEVRTHLFDEPVVQAWGVVLGTAQQYLNERWREVVYNPFRRTLGGSYPFDRSSIQDAPVMDVAAFFDPASGPVTVFVTEEMAPFLGRDVSRPRTWEGRGIRLSASAQNAIQRTKEIADNLFNGGAMRVNFDLQPEQPVYAGSAPTASQVSLELLGQRMDYRLGAQPTLSYEWPNDPGAVVSISTGQGTLPAKRYEGDWALFRMLQDARVQRKTSSRYEVAISFGDPRQFTITAIFNLTTRSASNPFNNPTGFFNFNPPERLN